MNNFYIIKDKKLIGKISEYEKNILYYKKKLTILYEYKTLDIIYSKKDNNLELFIKNFKNDNIIFFDFNMKKIYTIHHMIFNFTQFYNNIIFEMDQKDYKLSNILNEKEYSRLMSQMLIECL